MKKLIINSSLLLLTVTGFCQTQKGSWLVGTNIGSGAYSSEKAKASYSYSTTEYNDDYNTFSIGISPYGLYLIQDNLAIGATVGINYYHQKDESGNTSSAVSSTSKEHITTLSFDPEIRKYFGTAGSKMQPWVNIFGGVNTAPSKQTTSTSNSSLTTSWDEKSSGWNAGAGVGFSYFINSHIGIQYYVNYRHSYFKDKYDIKPTTGSTYNYTEKYTYDDINFGVGLQIHLGRKGK